MARKGITPVIAIIVLLLITVALAGAAWSFMSAYWEGLVAKSIHITDSYCSTNEATVLIRNTGTGKITLENDNGPASDIIVINTIAGTNQDGEWEDLSNNGITEAAPGKVFKFVFSCTPAGSMCNVRFIVGGKSLPASVQC